MCNGVPCDPRVSLAWIPGSGFLEPEDDEDPLNRWLTADLAEHGQIRIRLSKSIGLQHVG